MAPFLFGCNFSSPRLLTDARALKKAESIAMIARSYQLVRARLPKKEQATLIGPLRRYCA